MDLYILLLLSINNTLHHEETFPVYFFSKFCQNNLNSYNSKTNVIRTTLNPREDSNYMSSTVFYRSFGSNTSLFTICQI